MSSRPSRPVILSSVMLLLAACGGGGGSAPSDGSRVTYVQLTGWLDLASNRVKLSWFDGVQDATRYLVEQQDSNGAWAVMDSFWAAHDQTNGSYPGNAIWQGVINAPATLRVEAVTPGSRVLLGTTVVGPSGGIGTTLTFARPASLPSIELDQPEPLENPTQITLGNATDLSGEITVDTLPLPTSQIAHPTLTLNPGSMTSGTHIVYAMFAVEQPSAAVLLISRSVQTHNSKLAIDSIKLVSSLGVLDDYLLATADTGIASMVASVDATAVETVVAPNACVPPPCAAGQAFNGYHLSADVHNLTLGAHTFGAEATDNAGNTDSYRTVIPLPVPASGTLDSPVDGAVVSGTLPVSGTFSSGTPGALEIMITLNGNPIYNTTVANTGVVTSFSGEPSLSGVAPGYHNLHAYVRVGNTMYTEVANIIVQVAAAP